jgi:phytoene dehydrogenase-like protein
MPLFDGHANPSEENETEDHMSASTAYDAVVVGSGPNGLAAAITLVSKGHSVLLLEAKDTVGGGTRTKELTLPGCLHDVCSAVHPLGAASPFFRSLPLEEYGLEWVQPPAPLAHPLDDGRVAVLERSIEATAKGLGTDGNAYNKLMSPLVRNWEALLDDLLGPLHFPRHAFTTMRFGAMALRSASRLARARFKGQEAQALFAGIAAHSIRPLDRSGTAAFGLMLGAAGHAAGWPIAKGGSQSIADALAQCLVLRGGEIRTSTEVRSVDDLPTSRVVLFDITPKQLATLAGQRISGRYKRRLETFRYGPGVFKVDWALDGPIPWQAPECHRAATVHVGGTLEEILDAEATVWEDAHPEQPMVILAQPSLFDPTRAAEGMHTAWAYCHVPNSSNFDMTDRIESQVERFAPGFRDRIVGRHTMAPSDMEDYNPNYIGGDIAGGAQNPIQLFLRPLGRWRTYSTPISGWYICSSSMPPGAGVHGMCGYHAAQAALKALG